MTGDFNHQSLVRLRPLLNEHSEPFEFEQRSIRKLYLFVLDLEAHSNERLVIRI